jgi:cell division protein FtsI (penicillin-binding protein 3)
MWQLLSRVGFGSSPGSGLAGEAVGVLPHFFEWREIHRATLSFGYGLSVSALQLARAYSAIASNGRLPESSLLFRERASEWPQVISPEVTRHLRRMLEAVTGPGGTGARARVHGYRVGGKTGTVRKPEPGGYSEERYLAVFAGMAPMSDPRLVIVVMVDEPRSQKYHGGDVAAPVFAEVAAGSLRVLGVAPDDPRVTPGSAQRLARAAESGARASR